MGEVFLPHLSDGWKERDARTVHIGRLPEGVKAKEDVARAFELFGSTTHIHIQPDLKFGFVHFEEEYSAAAALEAQSVEVCGGQVQIRPAVKTGERTSSPGLKHIQAQDPELHSDVPDDVSQEASSEGEGIAGLPGAKPAASDP